MNEEVKPENQMSEVKKKSAQTPVSKEVQIALRREKISELMLAGYDEGGIRRITEFLNKAGFDCKKSTVANDIKFLLQQATKNSSENLELMRAMAFKQLESLRQAHWLDAQKGNLKSGKFAREVIKDQRELYGLNAAQKLEHSNPDGSGLMAPLAAAVNQFNQAAEKIYGNGNKSTDNKS